MAGLSREILRLNQTLRLRHERTGQESRQAAELSRRVPASSLPAWLRAGERCCYVSQSRGDSHSVQVKRIDGKEQTVTIVFESDGKTWKKVRFADLGGKMGDGALRPVFKGPEQVSTVAGPPPQAGTPSTRPRPRAVEAISSDEDVASVPTAAPAGRGKPAKVAMPSAATMLVPRAVALRRQQAASTSSVLGPTQGPEEPDLKRRRR